MITKQCFARAIAARCTLLVAAGFLVSVSAVPTYAENILFDGSDEALLKNDPLFDGRNSLFSSTSQSGNIITLAPISGGDFVPPYQIYGGLATAGQEVSNNQVHINGGTVMRSVYGGYNIGNDSGSIGAVRNNSVVITQGSIASNVFGGYNELKSGDSGLVEGNSVLVSGGIINGSIVGGASQTELFKPGSSTIKGNSVTVTDGTIYGSVTGADSQDDGYNSFGNVVSDNWIRIEGGVIRQGVSGALSTKLDLVNNNVIITGGEVDSVTLALTQNGKVIGNRLELSNAKTTSISGAISHNNDAINNSIVLDVGKMNNILGSGSYGMSDYSPLVKGNTLTIHGGEFDTIFANFNMKGNIEDNIVTITGGTIGDLKVAYGSNDGTNPEYMKGNIANISGGAITKLYGGYVTDNGFKANASNSHINVSGGTIGNIYAGAILSMGDAKGDAINNTVTLSGGVITGNIYGGYFEGVVDGDLRTGNTLNLEGYRGSVSGIYNFENYNWVLPKDVVNGDVMITITGSDAVDLTGTKQTIAMVNDGNVLNIGDKVTLIDKAHGYGSQNMVVNQGFFLSYDMTVSDDDGALALVVGNKNDSTPPPVDPTEPTKPVDPTNPVVPTEPTDPVKVNPTSKAFLEGRAAALAFVNQGGELIAGYGIQAAKTAVSDGSQNGLGFVPFVIANGGSSRYKTGSHVDVDGFNSVIGLAAGGEVGQGHQLTLGAFFEFGRGNYDSYNSFGSYGSVHGDGDTNYTGGGVLFRMDIAGTGLGRVANLPKDVSDGLYVEGSFRGGKVDMDFDSSDLIDGEGYRGRYDSKVTYLGAHGAVGYVFNFDAKQSLDVYGRYMWTKMDGDTVLIGKDKLHFGSSESSRIRVGGRYSYQMNEQVKPYVGLAYEHEFKGDIAARAYDLKLDKPSLKGDTGVLELGVSFKPVKDKPLSIDVAAEGYAGQRQGGGGSLKLKYQF